MASGSNEVEEGMNSVVPETRVSFDSRFFGKNVIILPFEIANNLAKGSFVIDLVSEARGVDNGE